MRRIRIMTAAVVGSTGQPHFSFNKRMSVWAGRNGFLPSQERRRRGT